MPTLLQDRAFELVDERLIAAFDLERLALLSEPEPTIERPQAEPRFRLRGTLAALLLAIVAVSALATLPASAAIARACSIGN